MGDMTRAIGGLIRAGLAAVARFHLLYLLAVTAVVLTFVLVRGTGELQERLREVINPIGSRPDPAPALPVIDFAWQHFRLWALLLLPMAVVRLVATWPKVPMPTVCWLAGMLAVALVGSDVAGSWGSFGMDDLGREILIEGYIGKLVALTLVVFFVPLGLAWYRGRPELGRYVTRQVMVPLMLCFFGVLSLFVAIDLINHQSQLSQAQGSQLAQYYLAMLPPLVVELSPLALLLSTLYVMSRMSRSNELVAMMNAGRSLGQIVAPIFMVAILATIFSIALNYHWAPRAEGVKNSILRAMTEESDGRSDRADQVWVQAQLYESKLGNRTWYVSAMPFDLTRSSMDRVYVWERDEEGQVVREIVARRANWIAHASIWRFFVGSEVRFEGGIPVSENRFDGQEGRDDRIGIDDLPDTPWNIVSAALSPDYMSVPELWSYLKSVPESGEGAGNLGAFRAHRIYRFSLPFGCLAVALFTAPLGIAYSRRGVLGGIVLAIVFFFIYLFFDRFCFTLGSRGHAPPGVVALPPMAMAIIGLGLLWLRSKNRPLPPANPLHWFRRG
jgi:LPS export ABC transporter permease LptG